MSEKLKILLLSNYLSGELDSGYRIRYHTGEILSRDPNIDVTIIFPSTKSYSFSITRSKKNFKIIETLGVLPARFRRGGFSIFDLIYKTFNIIKTKYDIIHVDMGHRPAGFLPAFFGKKIHKSVIINEWWDWYGKGGMADFRNTSFLQKNITRYDDLFEVLLTKKYDGVIAITNYLKNTLRNATVYDNTIVLYGGAETSNLISSDIKKARSILGLQQDNITIGMINICVEDEEDNTIFWKAFSELTQEYDRLMLLVTGKRDYVSDQFLPKITFEDRIIYPGWVSRQDYALYLSSCDFFVLPLRNTFRNAARWPNKISDYFSIKRPVLTNPVGDLEHLFEKYQLGVLCNTNTKSFYEKTKLLLDNYKYRKDCCSGQSEFVHKQLDFDKRVDKIHDFYVSLLK